MALQSFCFFCKTFCHINWTRLTLIICALPCTLVFIALHLVIIVMTDTPGAIVSNTDQCAEIGKDVLDEGGSAVDAAVAVMFCEGVVTPRETGLGGGFTALLYMNGMMETVIATPTAPQNSPLKPLNENYTIPDAKAGGVPGELLGYWEMHQKHGLLPWKRLLKPSIEICNQGIDITTSQSYLSLINKRRRRRQQRHSHTQSQSVSKLLFFPNSINGTIKLQALAMTLQRIANEGAKVFYNGDIGKAFVRDVQKDGGFLTMEDLRNYRVTWKRDVITFNLPNRMKVYTTPLPSSGCIIALAMNIIKAYKDVNTPVFWHRVVEASKHALGLGLALGDYEHENDKELIDFIKKRYTKMLDMDFARKIRAKIYDDRIVNDSSYYGGEYAQLYSESSVHVSVLATNGETVSITSSLMWPLGSMFRSNSTGIFWNDQLQGFKKTQNPPGRRLRPGKRSLSPHSPVIILPTMKSKPILTVGATGGPYMPTQIITALTRFCLMGQNVNTAVNSGYLHPHIKNKYVEFDDESPQEILDYLRKVGHKLVHISDSLRHFGIAGIGNVHAQPDPEISLRRMGGEILIHPARSMSTFFVIIIIVTEFSILVVMIRDYFEAERNLIIYEDDDV